MSGGSVVPAIDLFQTEAEVVVKAALRPQIGGCDYLRKGRLLTLYGEIKQENGKKEATYSIREHRYGSFERSIMLPTDVQTDKARADFENGVLTISLPKAESVKRRRSTSSQIRAHQVPGPLTGTGNFYY